MTLGEFTANANSDRVGRALAQFRAYGKYSELPACDAERAIRDSSPDWTIKRTQYFLVADIVRVVEKPEHLRTFMTITTPG
jgi:hypothetical protein